MAKRAVWHSLWEGFDPNQRHLFSLTLLVGGERCHCPKPFCCPVNSHVMTLAALARVKWVYTRNGSFLIRDLRPVNATRLPPQLPPNLRLHLRERQAQGGMFITIVDESGRYRFINYSGPDELRSILEDWLDSAERAASSPVAETDLGLGAGISFAFGYGATLTDRGLLGPDI